MLIFYTRIFFCDLY